MQGGIKNPTNEQVAYAIELFNRRRSLPFKLPWNTINKKIDELYNYYKSNPRELPHLNYKDKAKEILKDVGVNNPSPRQVRNVITAINKKIPQSLQQNPWRMLRILPKRTAHRKSIVGTAVGFAKNNPQLLRIKVNGLNFQKAQLLAKGRYKVILYLNNKKKVQGELIRTFGVSGELLAKLKEKVNEKVTGEKVQIFI